MLIPMMSVMGYFIPPLSGLIQATTNLQLKIASCVRYSLALCPVNSLKLREK
jgi:hypothetical protein